MKKLILIASIIALGTTTAKAQESFQFGVKGGVDSFEGEIKENMERELKFIVQRKIKDQVFNGLREVSEFEVPKALIQREIEASKQKLL